MLGFVDRTEYERQVRLALAGVFRTTPLDHFVSLGGDPDKFDQDAQDRMAWNLRTYGYSQQWATPSLTGKPEEVWVRTSVWPEDRPWLEDDEDAILDQIERGLR